MKGPEARPDQTRVHIFSDFDGTITETDTLVFLAQNLGGGPSMVEAIGRLIREGKISLREGIAAEMRSIRAPFSDAVALLRERVRIDPGFPAFASWCRTERLPLTILSAGFRELIELFLPASEYSDFEIRANTLLPDEERGWQCSFLDRTEYGHDKAAALREAQQQGKYVIFIGDGLSDRAPADIADEVFAKHGLAEYCRARGIISHEYKDFAEVKDELARRIGA